ncbi:RNA helicase [Caenorhabditis elegans]|uniref:RNA helicase n=1 Tax=Caenorhabditis elegans TaxID=6239 RepID=Q93382_CAEEL|nr:RNA helicase [Caenorhabditis elegans]CAB03765.1 RNA helicase [Caenorhabditis elegans]|eukprot:NP_497743.1 Uncharacterized protein CELE_C46F11.4 [Caenorhabditis elegans]
MWRGKYSGGYQNRFVSAKSSGTSSLSDGKSMNNVPPPAALTVGNAPVPPPNRNILLSNRKEQEMKKEQEYANLMAYGSTSEKQSRRKRIYDDEYLEGGSDDEKPASSSSKLAADDDDEEDELDAFMAGIEKQASSDKKVSEQKEKDRKEGKDTEDPSKKGLGRADIDEEDMQESLFKFMEEYKEKHENDDEQLEYDEDGNIIWSWKKVIDPLPDIDHSQIQYQKFNKNFYEEHEDIKRLHYMDVIRLQNTMNLRVGGLKPPRPVCSFAHFSFDKLLMEAIRKSEYEQPTPIQAMAIPSALSGRDVLGIAKTGSGKTAAYLWPAIVHIMDQPDLKAGEGPVAVIVVPTRELAIQVFQEAKKFCKVYNINPICAYGGGSKWEQSNELQNEGAEMVVCTPGRIIDLVKMGATNFLRTTFLVFDEADRMFDMGFEAQVKSISDHVRPDRQCLMFSATFKQKVERLARDALVDPVRIVQGEVGEANADIEQKVFVMQNQDVKLHWLIRNLVEFASLGKVLIFVTKKLDSEDVAKKLKMKDFDIVLLHGDMLQAERNENLLKFRKKSQILVATDVAARGLDISEIRTVINFDMARDIDTHVHRIGRTGRAGHKGTAYTLVTEKDIEMVGHLVKNLESVSQEVPKPLMDLAMKSSWFRGQRAGNGGPSTGTQTRGRMGLGYTPKVRQVGGGATGAQFDPLKEQKSCRGGGNQTVDGMIRNAQSFATSSSSSSSSSSGPASGANRAQMLKSAFQKSFQTTFQRPTNESSNLPQQVASDPRPEWKKKVDELNAKIAQQQASSASGGSSSSSSSSKRSRWE